MLIADAAKLRIRIVISFHFFFCFSNNYLIFQWNTPSVNQSKSLFFLKGKYI
jgi:hypothetical protein